MTDRDIKTDDYLMQNVSTCTCIAESCSRNFHQYYRAALSNHSSEIQEYMYVNILLFGFQRFYYMQIVNSLDFLNLVWNTFRAKLKQIYILCMWIKSLKIMINGNNWVKMCHVFKCIYMYSQP